MSSQDPRKHFDYVGVAPTKTCAGACIQLCTEISCAEKKIHKSIGQATVERAVAVEFYCDKHHMRFNNHNDNVIIMLCWSEVTTTRNGNNGVTISSLRHLPLLLLEPMLAPSMANRPTLSSR
jgi:hypothetical protein